MVQFSDHGVLVPVVFSLVFLLCVNVRFLGVPLRGLAQQRNTAAQLLTRSVNAACRYPNCKLQTLQFALHLVIGR